MAASRGYLKSAILLTAKALLFAWPMVMAKGQAQPIHTIYSIDGMIRGQIASHDDSTIFLIEWLSHEVVEIQKSSSVIIKRYERDITDQYLSAKQLALTEEIRTRLKREILLKRLIVLAVGMPLVLFIIGSINNIDIAGGIWGGF